MSLISWDKSFSSSPSAMMRISGSVPEARTSTRPEPFSRASAAAMAAFTPSLANGSPPLNRTFSSFCGTGSNCRASALIGLPVRIITASTWGEWPFAPLRFEGMTKHSMATAVRSIFHNGQAALPYLDDFDLADPATADLRLLARQLANIKPMPTKTSYSSYKMADPKIGDDLFDAMMAAVWGLVTRGAASAPTAILMRSRSRGELLEGG